MRPEGIRWEGAASSNNRRHGSRRVRGRVHRGYPLL